MIFCIVANFLITVMEAVFLSRDCCFNFKRCVGNKVFGSLILVLFITVWAVLFSHEMGSYLVPQELTDVKVYQKLREKEVRMLASYMFKTEDWIK